ncbi:amino acid/amide ABC transporter ATP-binding protein 1, HAAT family [Jatrophihabitans endophyticus]|uniref:Amino acid/amide ABC transporter ATP-binding protein 1, HAAT family n=1 Tax=Jatrophihabitans endophyticus TaxID=1206085 RepID=A0A1M5Q087_9ACTN|nr:ABC transporter ATP-binding protein [Jatrophihabitans endophyticus]SHH07326.1 amino acid/amide ABC transporter ATP-binding protein 1, HAAT family [Jatrophihabitans endophyticus]
MSTPTDDARPLVVESSDIPERAAPVLETTGLSVHYGGVAANRDVSISVRPGEVVGLIGPNGAGKTSFVDAVTGFASYSGSVRLAGEVIDGLPSYARRRAGLARTWQAGELFDQLTVAENLELVVEPGGIGAVLRDVLGRRSSRRRVTEQVRDVLEMTELTDVADRVPSELSLGLQKLVGVARAVASDAKVLLLDEPAAGLSSSESQEFGRSLQKFVDRGIGILMIDHDMDLIMNYTHRLFVLNFGSIIAEGDPAQIRDDPAVISAYLGATESEEQRHHG